MSRKNSSFRLAVSGPPGAGKSTFIESFGTKVIDSGQTLAVLTIDPSSPVSGGSILGDKTRMTELSRNPQAFIRPTPSSGVLGGVAENTNDVITVCEAAGYSFVIVETVGVGQSEFLVTHLVDMVMLLLPPAGGDDLQGIKKGIMEIADLVVINKADGPLVAAAQQARNEVTAALRFMRPRLQSWQPKAVLCSALENDKIDDVWKEVQSFHDAVFKSHELDIVREQQRHYWMWSLVESEIMSQLKKHPQVQSLYSSLHQRVAQGNIPPRQAAYDIVRTFLQAKGHTENA